jgi:DNA-directed RNA polymerase subunit E'/Rpb7
MAAAEMVNLKLFIKPSDLDHNIEKNIISKIENKQGTYIQGRGFIKTINQNSIQYKKGIIQSNTGEVMFSVFFDAIFVNPKKGDIFDMKVKESKENYITVTKDNILVFIPRPRRNLTTGDNVKIQIEATRFKKNNLDIIGKVI